MDEVFNAEVWLVERHLQSGRANHVALVGTETVTYGQLAALVADVAAGLRGLGLARDDRIVFVTNDDIPMASGILAAFRAGFVAVPVSTMLGGDELGEIIVDCGATVVVASAEYADAVRIAVKTAPDVRRLILEEPVDIEVPERIAVSLWDELIEAGAKAPESDKAVAPTTGDSWALWLYTSGTTGRPKGAMHTHVNIRHVCGTYANQVLGIGEDDICFSIAKLFFAYGIGNTLFFPLSVGATSCLDPRRPAPHVVAERITADRPTLFSRFRRSTQHCSEVICPRRHLIRFGWVSLPGSRCRPRYRNDSPTGSASRFWTASARPKHCTFTCPIDPGNPPWNDRSRGTGV